MKWLALDVIVCAARVVRVIVSMLALVLVTGPPALTTLLVIVKVDIVAVGQHIPGALQLITP